MDWKERLGISTDEQAQEEEKEYVFDARIDAHFLNLGFYYDMMKPRFFNEESHVDQIKDSGAAALRYDGDWDWDNGGTQRVFMNRNEVYVERQTNYRSFDGSSYHDFESAPASVARIEEILERLVRKYGE